jgi:hypothetical protein
VLGEDHPDVVSTRHNLAATRSRHPDTPADDAIDLLLANLEDLRARFGASDPRTLAALGLVAEHAQQFDRHELPAETLAVLVAARSSELGPDAVLTLKSRHMFAESLRLLDRHQESIAVAGAAVDDAARTYGPAALVTLEARAQLAVSLIASNLAAEHPNPEVEDRIDEVLAALAATDLTNLEPDHPVRAEVEQLLSGERPDDAEHTAP